LACCAFAVFLLTQLLVPFRALGRLLGWSRAWQPDTAVVWRPGAAMAPPRAPRRRLQLYGAMLAVNTALFLTLANTGLLAQAPRIAPEGTRAAALEAILHARICGEDARRG
jgi:hypothetical protein